MGCGCVSKLADVGPQAAVVAVVAVVERLLDELGREPSAAGGNDAHASKLQATLEEVNQGLSSLFGYTQPHEADGVFQRAGTDSAMHWQNWGQTVTLQPIQGADKYPKTTAEVVALVQDAARQGRRVRCIGHGHTWTPAFFDGGNQGKYTVIFSRDLQVHGDTRRLVVARPADAANGVPARVRLAAGVSTRELAEFMEAHRVELGGVGLASDVILDNVRYAGVISMACHGTGRSTRTVPDMVCAMTLVDGQGSVHQVSRDQGSGHVTADDFTKFMRAAFGLTGVIIDLTLELDSRLDKPNVMVQHSFPKMSHLFDRPDGPAALKQLVEGNEAVELFWMPMGSVSKAELADFADNRFVNNWRPYDDPMWTNIFTERALHPGQEPVRYGYEADGKSRLARERLSTQAGVKMNHLGCKLLKANDDKLSSLRLQALAGILLSKTLSKEASWSHGYLRGGYLSMPKAIHYKNYIDDFPVYDFEVCIPVDPSFQNVYDAWRAVVRLVEADIRQGHFNTMNVALECRFTLGTTDVVTSPAYTTDDKQMFAWIEVLASTATPLDRWLAFVSDVHKAWLSIPHPGGARPKLHWAKWNDIPNARNLPGGQAQWEDWVTPYAQDVYKSQIQEFKEFLRRYQQGDGPSIFANEWLCRVLQLP